VKKELASRLRKRIEERMKAEEKLGQSNQQETTDIKQSSASIEETTNDKSLGRTFLSKPAQNEQESVNKTPHEEQSSNHEKSKGKEKQKTTSLDESYQNKNENLSAITNLEDSSLDFSEHAYIDNDDKPTDDEMDFVEGFTIFCDDSPVEGASLNEALAGENRSPMRHRQRRSNSPKRSLKKSSKQASEDSHETDEENNPSKEKRKSKLPLKPSTGPNSIFGPIVIKKALR
jgi:hypothetical protein